MEIKDLLGLKEPLVKLFEVVSSGIGVLYEPTRIKKKALAEAEAVKIKSKVIEEALKENPEATALALVCESDKLSFKDVSELTQRALASHEYRLAKEQQNIEDVVSSSVKYLGSTVSEEPVDPEWRDRFFSKAKFISHEQMQEVWGKVLAGEITSPGTYSLRSLELLSNLTHSEAELFRKFSPYVELNTGYALIPQNQVGKNGFNNEFNFGYILKLQDCGLLVPRENLGFTQEILAKGAVAFRYGHGIMLVNNSSEANINQRFEILSLTSCGKELIKLLEPLSWNENYLTDLKAKYSKLVFSYPN